MAQVLVLYNKPADQEAFYKYYYEKHVPIAKRIPGLRSYVVSATPPMMLGNGQAPYLIAELEFDSAAAIQAALMSPEGQATAADLANFATAGATIMAFDTKTV